jgi:hypothetical protein
VRAAGRRGPPRDASGDGRCSTSVGYSSGRLIAHVLASG